MVPLTVERSKRVLARNDLAPARARNKYATPFNRVVHYPFWKGRDMRQFLTVRIEVKINVAACLMIALLLVSILT